MGTCWWFISSITIIIIILIFIIEVTEQSSIHKIYDVSVLEIHFRTLIILALNSLLSTLSNFTEWTWEIHYYCKEYKRTTKTITLLCMKVQMQLRIALPLSIFFVEVEHPSTHSLLPLAVVQHLSTCVFAVNGQQIPHMLYVSSRQMRYIPIQSIKCKCVLIEL